MLSCFKLRKLRKELKEVRLAAARRLISDDDILSDDKKAALRAIVDEASAVDLPMLSRSVRLSIPVPGG